MIDVINLKKNFDNVEVLKGNYLHCDSLSYYSAYQNYGKEAE